MSIKSLNKSIKRLIKSIKRLIKSIKRSISQLKDPKSQDISKSEIYGLFWSLGLHLTIFDPFWISFGSLSIEFNFLMKLRSNSDDGFRSKKSIKRGFKSNSKQILGLSRFNCLSLTCSNHNSFNKYLKCD